MLIVNLKEIFKMGKINLIGAGGAGIKIVHHVYNAILNSGADDKYKSELKTIYIDTANVNINKIEHDANDFHLIDSGKLTKELSGSGGDRTKNVTEIANSLDYIIDKFKLYKASSLDMNIVFGSTSGGSGSVIAPLLVRKLLRKKIVTMPVLVGDSRTLAGAKNTLGTIKTYDAFANAESRPLVMIYYNNGSESVVTTAKQRKMTEEEHVNDQILAQILDYSILYSGGVGDIDQQDVANIVSPGEYTIVNVTPGLYGSMTNTDNIPVHCNDNKSKVIMARSLGKPKKDIPKLLQYKRADFPKELSKYYNSDNLNVFICSNPLTGEIQRLNNTISGYAEYNKSTNSDQLSTAVDLDNDLGIII